LANVVRAIVHMFVFISAGENYVTMVYPALNINRFGIFFFAAGVFLGISNSLNTWHNF